MPIAAARRISTAATGSSSIGDQGSGLIVQTARLIGLVAHWTPPLPV
jgi:hypothetical protein